MRLRLMTYALQGMTHAPAPPDRARGLTSAATTLTILARSATIEAEGRHKISPK